MRVLAIVSVLVAACSSSESSGTTAGGVSGGAATCESTGKSICERACACGNGAGTCKTGFKGASGATTTFTWNSQGDCEAAFAGTRCAKDGAAGVDFSACQSAVESGNCEADVFVDPPACEKPRDGG